MRRAVLALLALLAPAAPAAAAPVRLGAGPGGLQALAAHAGVAYAVVGSADPLHPYSLVQSSGRGAGVLGGFGQPHSGFPDVAVGDDGRVTVAWAVTRAAGEDYVARTSGGEPQSLGNGTGPARLAAGAGPLIAYPDVDGDAALAQPAPPAAAPARAGASYPLDGPPHALAVQPLTFDAPFHRHLPLDLTLRDGAAYVLDLDQRRGQSALLVIGPGAPAAPVVSVPALRGLDATLAIDGNRLYVAYLRSGRAWLASAALTLGSPWSHRKLPGTGGEEGAPAVARASGRTYVAFSQRSGQRDVFLTTIAGGSQQTRRLTTSPLDDSRPMAAPTGDGGAFIGWTRRRRRAVHGTAFLLRVG